MKHVKIAGLCLVSMFVMGLAVSSVASAAPVWEGCLSGGTTTKYSTNACAKAEASGTFSWQEITNTDKSITIGATISLADTATLINSEIVCTSGGRIEGTVGPGSFDTIAKAEVENAATNCRGTKSCGATTVKKVAGVHLPWQTKLSEENGKVLDTIENSGAGEPGWLVECEVGSTLTTDECVSEGSTKYEKLILTNELTGGVQLVKGVFAKAHKAKCSKGGAERGVILGLGASLLAKEEGGKLVASGIGLRVS